MTHSGMTHAERIRHRRWVTAEVRAAYEGAPFAHLADLDEAVRSSQAYAAQCARLNPQTPPDFSLTAGYRLARMDLTAALRAHLS